MGLKILNTLSRQLEEFVPLDPAGRQVRMYCCGPTVYDFGHIGNFRTFVFSDLVRRYLEFRGFDVVHVMNITDVEDKIIKRVSENRTTLREFVSRFENAFLEDLQTLQCRRPHHLPRATEHIPEMIALIDALLKRGVAYQAPDKSIYFSIEKYRGCGCRYGQLVNLNFDAMRVGERVASDEYSKDALADFALWKARVPEDGEVFWASPWGEGRPGWHIECSAMSMKLLGPSFDLHLGGEDLAFPHHEDEIAQSEGAGLQKPGERFVKYWMHGAHLLVEGKKMAKSLGNFFTLRDLLGRGFSGREVRQVLISSHYRETFNFTLGGLESARSALQRLDECLAKLDELAAGAPRPTSGPSTSAGQGPAGAVDSSSLIGEFTAAMDEDCNVSAGWAVVFKWVSQLNRALAANLLKPAEAVAALAAWQQVDGVLGVGRKATDEAPPEIVALLNERQAARQAKDFKKSDAVRDELKAKGWLIEDTPKGPKLRKAG
jgi:cysteinyl-tRNA synthetase